MAEHRFTVEGGFDIADTLRPTHAADESVVGFRLPDGRIVRLVVALEVESEDGSTYTYVTSEQEMDALGFAALDYDHLTFYPQVGG